VSLAWDAGTSPENLSPEEEKERREDKLSRLLKSYEEDALGYAQSEIVQQQIDSLDRYFGKLYGDEEEGRSQVTTREVLEGIEWTRPDLMRVFASGGQIISVQESTPEDARYAKDAADYLTWMFFTDNPGFELLDDFGFDGLLHRRGYLANYWRDQEYQAPQTLTGLDIAQVQMLMQDPQVEIIGQDFDNEHSEVGGITLVVRRIKSPARAEIVSIAPEDMRLNGRAIDIDSARYVGRVIRMLRGEAAREWPDKEEEIWGFKGAQAGMTGAVRRSEDVRQTRFQDDRNDVWRSKAQGDDASTELEVLEEYIRADLNGDGYPELIRAYRIGDTILEEEEVEENPFWTWTPIRLPHRFMGIGYYELLADLQRQSTVITRAGLDALYQSVVNREAYNKNTVDVDSLLATYSGAKVAVDGDPAGSILPLTGGLPTAQNAWEALEVIKNRIEDRTGASRQTRGLDADRLSADHSGKALNLLQINADARKEMVARNMAIGLGNGFSKLYRLVCRHQNAERQAKVGGKWAQFDPRTWNSDLKVSIQAGGMNREHTLATHMLIGAEQEKVIEVLGPGNPIVTPKNRYAWQEDLCRIAGVKDATPYFTEVPDQPEMGPDGQPVVDPETGQPKMKPWAPEPQPDPAMAKVEADMQMAQAEQQITAQTKAAELQLKTQEATANMQLQGQKDAATLEAQREKAALDLQLARDKAAAEIQLAREKADAEIMLAREKAQAELELERERMAMEASLESERIASQERIGKEAALSKNRSGGSLSE